MVCHNQRKSSKRQWQHHISPNARRVACAVEKGTSSRAAGEKTMPFIHVDLEETDLSTGTGRTKTPTGPHHDENDLHYSIHI